MKLKRTNFYHAENLQQLLYYKESISGIQVVGNCTQIENISDNAVSTTSIPELRIISKHERFIDIGPAVTLSEIHALGNKHLPDVLFKAIETIATPFVRNLATIGGNLFNKEHKSTLYSTMLSMNALLEMKSKDQTKLIKFSNFEEIPTGFVVTKIRIPIEYWDSELFLRFGPQNQLDSHSASYTSLIKTEKNVISDIRLSFAGPIAYKFSNLENNLLGVKLPLTKATVFPLVEEELKSFCENLDGNPDQEKFLILTKNALLQTLLNIF